MGLLQQYQIPYYSKIMSPPRSLVHSLVLVLVTVSHTNAFVTVPRSTQTPQSSTTTSPSPLAFFNFGKPSSPEVSKQDEKETTTTTISEESTVVDEDPVEKLFSFFFGKPQEEPFGLKRFGKERFPEQYPAIIDEWAEPLAEDESKDIAVLRPLLKNTNMEFRKLSLTYSANQQGWDAYKFHQAVDRKGGALVVCTTQDGLLCGGYNPKGWVGYGEARGSIAAFLFRQNNGGAGFTKLRKVGGPGLAQM